MWRSLWRKESTLTVLSLFETRHDKTNKMTVRQAKTQISLSIRPVWSESSLCAQWVAKDPNFLHADNEDSDQTGRMPSLIWVFVGRTAILLVLSCRGSLSLLCWFSPEKKFLVSIPTTRIRLFPFRYCTIFLSLYKRNNIHFVFWLIKTDHLYILNI